MRKLDREIYEKKCKQREQNKEFIIKKNQHIWTFYNFHCLFDTV